MITIVSALLEENFYLLMKNNLASDEKIEYNQIFDFRFPNGFKKIGWPPNTSVEIKYKLIFNTYDRIVEQCRKLKNKPSKLIIVISDESDIHRGKRDNVDGCDIEVCLFKDLKDKFPHSDLFLDAKDSFPYEKELRNKLKNNSVSLFLGAGVGKSANIADWSKLIEELGEGMNWINGERDLVIRGRHIVKERERSLKEDIRKKLYARNPVPSQLIKAIANIIKKRKNVESVITYNYDDLLENCLGWSNAAIYANLRMLDTKYKPIYHVHGFIPQKGECTDIILGEEEYHKIYQDNYNWSNVEQLHALTRNTCLFIGLSMKDPNLRRLIDISRQGSTKEARHYVFYCEEDEKIDPVFFAKDMSSFGIKCVKCQYYDDLPKLLNGLVE